MQLTTPEGFISTRKLINWLTNMSTKNIWSVSLTVGVLPCRTVSQKVPNQQPQEVSLHDLLDVSVEGAQNSSTWNVKVIWFKSKCCFQLPRKTSTWNQKQYSLLPQEPTYSTSHFWRRILHKLAAKQKDVLWATTKFLTEPQRRTSKPQQM